MQALKRTETARETTEGIDEQNADERTKTLQMTTEVWEALASTENNEVIDKEMTPIETLIESVEEQGKTITTLVQVIKIQNAQMQEMSKAVNDLISELNYLRE